MRSSLFLHISGSVCVECLQPVNTSCHHALVFFNLSERTGGAPPPPPPAERSVKPGQTESCLMQERFIQSWHLSEFLQSGFIRTKSSRYAARVFDTVTIILLKNSVTTGFQRQACTFPE